MAHAAPFAVFVLLCVGEVGVCQKTTSTPPVTKDKDRHGCEVRDTSYSQSNISILRKEKFRKAGSVYFIFTVKLVIYELYGVLYTRAMQVQSSNLKILFENFV